MKYKPWFILLRDIPGDNTITVDYNSEKQGSGGVNKGNEHRNLKY